MTNKRHSLFLVLLLLTQISFTQKDTVKVQTIYSVVLEDGKPTRKRHVKSQITYNKNDHLIREINYEKGSPKINNYIWYFYKDDLCNKEERYDKNDDLIVAIKYEYGADNLLSGATHYVLKDNTDALKVSMTVNYIYDEKNRLLYKTGYNVQNKKTLSQKYKYKDEKNLILYKCKAKKGIPPCEIKKSMSIHQYNDKNDLVNILETKSLASGDKKSYTIDYNYNEEGTLKEVVYKNSKTESVERKEIYKNGVLSTILEYNTEGKLSNKLEYTYVKHYIYRSENPPKYLK